MKPATADQFRQLLIHPGDTIRASMACIDDGSVAIALMVDDEGRLMGTVSDGDIRRALLQGASLDDVVDPFVGRDPAVVPEGADRAAVLDLMRARKLSQIPEVDAEGRLLGLHVMHDVLGSAKKPNWAVVLAGGRGTRLGDLTASTPKPMLTVAGRPILERLVLHLVGSGIQRIFLSVSYLADQIRDHFQDGSNFGCSIDYLVEEPNRPLGTGGPLRLLRERHPAIPDPVLVMNGDLVASFSVTGLLETHAELDAAITIGLSEYGHDVPFGVVHLDEEDTGRVTWIEEKPRWAGLVNAGIYVLDPHVVARVPAQAPYPITDLVRTTIERGERVAGWQLTGEWHDVGRPHELARARGQTP